MLPWTPPPPPPPLFIFFFVVVVVVVVVVFLSFHFYHHHHVISQKKQKKKRKKSETIFDPPPDSNNHHHHHRLCLKKKNALTRAKCVLLLSKPELATLSFERSVRLLFLLRAAGGHRRDGTDSGRNHANPAERDGSATRVNVVSALR